MRFTAPLLSPLLVLLLLLLPVRDTAALDDGLALRPPLGWNSDNYFVRLPSVAAACACLLRACTWWRVSLLRLSAAALLAGG